MLNSASSFLADNLLIRPYDRAEDRHRRLLRRHHRRNHRDGWRRPDDPGPDLPRRRRRLVGRHRRPHRRGGLQVRGGRRPLARGIAELRARRLADPRLGAVRVPRARTSSGGSHRAPTSTRPEALHRHRPAARGGDIRGPALHPAATGRVDQDGPVQCGDRSSGRSRRCSSGAVGGLLVGITSVGSGSVIMIALLMLYPTLSAVKLVGTDLVQAVPLVIVCGGLQHPCARSRLEHHDSADHRVGSGLDPRRPRSPRGCRRRRSAAASSSC